MTQQTHRQIDLDRTVWDSEYRDQVKDALNREFGSGFLRNLASDCFIGNGGRDVESKVIPFPAKPKRRG